VARISNRYAHWRIYRDNTGGNFSIIPELGVALIIFAFGVAAGGLIFYGLIQFWGVVLP